MASWWFHTLISSSVAIGVAVFLGTFLAWSLHYYEFVGARWIRFLVALPLAIPPYLAAYTWHGFLDLNGPLSRFLAWWGVTDTFRLTPSGPVVLGAIVGFQLFPYVYFTVTPALNADLHDSMAAARILGRKGWHLFLNPGLPLLRPFIAAGALLVFMESLNEYGAASFLGVSTVTVGLMRAWTHAYDLTAAMQLGLGLCGLALFVTFMERFLRKRQRFGQGKAHLNPTSSPRFLSGFAGFVALLLVSLPLGLALFLPTLQLIWWGVRFDQISWTEAGVSSLQTIGLSAGVGFLALLLALAGLLLPRLTRIFWSKTEPSAVCSGWLADTAYGVPGVMAALAVLSLAGFAGLSISAFTTGMGLLIYALFIRYYAVGRNGLWAHFTHRILPHEGPATLLGVSRWKMLRTIHWPLLQPGIWATALLLMLDLVKELSATLLLRPVGLNTLATLLYEQSTQELPHLNALPGLALISTGVILILLLRLVQRSIRTP